MGLVSSHDESCGWVAQMKGLATGLTTNYLLPTTDYRLPTTNYYYYYYHHYYYYYCCCYH
eukprot:5708964-Prorocentrum_lima.AAC.1